MITLSRTRIRHAFSLTELLVVMAVIAVLIVVLLTALGAVQSTGRMTDSMTNVRQVASNMTIYAGDNRDAILPSQFNHHSDPWIGHPRCLPSLGHWHARGTWGDVLWTVHEMGEFPEALVALGNDYRFDSPDRQLYELVGTIDYNPLRSSAINSRNFLGTEPLATPFGDGAHEAGLPGYFAANNFFNDDQLSDTWNGAWSFGQIRHPDRSMYLVDSFAGEIIETATEDINGAAVADAFHNPLRTETAGPTTDDVAYTADTLQVDFRYNDNCLMLMLDGHVRTETEWERREDLEARGVRLVDLDRRISSGAAGGDAGTG